MDFRRYLKRRIKEEIYSVIKIFINLSENYSDKFSYKEGKLIAYGCKKRILFYIFNLRVQELFKKYTFYKIYDDKVVFSLKGGKLFSRWLTRL